MTDPQDPNGRPAEDPERALDRFRLDGRVAVVTGASSGLGERFARVLAGVGAHVVLAARRTERIEALAAALPDALAVTVDVTDDDGPQDLVDAALAHYGRLDVLVNNAGLGGDTRLVDMDDEEWDRVLDITLTGTMRCTRAALRIMEAQGHGVIVNNASVVGWRAQAGQTHYAAAKAGVMALTRCSAVEAAGSGIRINCVSPSLAMHPFLARTSSEELLASLVDGEAFGRAAEPWEVANVVVFLASDYSSYMTGEVVSVSSQHP